MLWDKQKCKSRDNARNSVDMEKWKPRKKYRRQVKLRETYPEMEEMLVLTAVIAARRLGGGGVYVRRP